MKKNVEVIYLMGAGRSGTTALATFLGNSQDILTVGEMHQFFDHIANDKPCSCGKLLKECEVWSKILDRLPQDFIEKASYYKDFCEKFEYHTAVPKYLFNRYDRKELKEYRKINEAIFVAISDEFDSRFILDSAKYIGRYLGLKRTSINMKTIYVIRDIRGVVASFSKNVQTSRGFLSSVFYWIAVNSVGEILYRLNKQNVLKVKYEELIMQPIEEFSKIEKFLKIDLSEIKKKIQNNEFFTMPHIVGGNRLKENKIIKFQQDIGWRKEFSKKKKIGIYLIAFPLMILNRFKI